MRFSEFELDFSILEKLEHVSDLGSSGGGLERRPAHRLGLSALEFFESLDSETDPSLSDLFRVFDRFGKLRGDQRPIFGIELERFFARSAASRAIATRVGSTGR